MTQTPSTVIEHVIGYAEVAGHLARIEIVISRPQSSDAQAAADPALESARARREPPDNHFKFTGSVWPQFFDRVRRNNQVTFNYNPTGDPTSGGGLTAVQHSEATWSSVPGSSFRFRDGGLTDRTPSAHLAVCSGGDDQSDGFNDIGWCKIPSQSPDWLILGLAATLYDWNTAETIENDVIFNTDIAPSRWSNRTGDDEIDLESVILQELGHTAGLDHSYDPSSVMYRALLVWTRSSESGWSHMNSRSTPHTTASCAM